MNMYDMQNKLGLHDFVIDKWAVDNEVPYIVIYFEDILDDPKETIENLVHFLDIDGVDINKAIDNVDER